MKDYFTKAGNVIHAVIGKKKLIDFMTSYRERYALHDNQQLKMCSIEFS